MKNKEIEELLNKMKNCNGVFDYYLEYGEVDLLLSYIEQLEKLCNKYEQEHKTTFEIWKEDIKKLKQLQNNRDKAIEILGQYKHYSTPTEEQNSENEDIVDNAYNILKGDSDE